ncbi:MAG: hypothetical protein ACR2IP_00740 [Solirubrobacteraceae bacterium]
MTYSIFASTGNLVDWFDNRDAALARRTDIVRSEPQAADDVFLVAKPSPLAMRCTRSGGIGAGART